jgi:hypothetical protein
VVEVRPNPKVAGYVPASATLVSRISGFGAGSALVDVVNSDLVPADPNGDHVFKITFWSPSPDSIRARSYALIDSTTGEELFGHGMDFDGAGTGPVGLGLLPVISTLESVVVDSSRTGFTPQSVTNALLAVTYQDVLPIDQRRPRYPEDITIRFSDTVIDTSLEQFPFPAVPAKFTLVAHGKDGDHRLDFRFYDVDQDGTLSRADEIIDIVTYAESSPGIPQSTWFAMLDLTGQDERGPLVPPAGQDVFELKLTVPFGAEDVFAFSAQAAHIDPALAKQQFEMKPYVVPNPYVGSASFEPERFAVSGRGVRRIEFRGLPARCTIRIFTVLGELVNTLVHDGSNDGYVAWDLRSKDNLDVAPGLYIFHVDGGDLGRNMGKFAIIK